jgi:hypothetical protein
MMNRNYLWMIALVLFAASIVGFALLRPSHANAQPPQQYPIMDKVAAKIIAKYQNSTCNDLYQQKSQKAAPSPEEKKVIEYLHNDPKMRAAFINKIAAPIANKMFECGMIP